MNNRDTRTYEDCKVNTVDDVAKFDFDSVAAAEYQARRDAEVQRAKHAGSIVLCTIPSESGGFDYRACIDASSTSARDLPA